MKRTRSQYDWHVIVADNMPTTADETVEDLIDAGYEAEAVYSYDDMQAILEGRTHYAHAVVLDMRLRDDNDKHDESGWRLARDYDFPRIRVVFSRFDMRNASEQHFVKMAQERGLDSVSFVDKAKITDDELGLVARLDNMIAHHLKIDDELQLVFNDLSLPVVLADLLFKGARRERYWHELELNDLIRTAFYREHDAQPYRQLDVERLPLQREGRVWLQIGAHTRDGDLHHYVVAIGHIDQIAAMNQNLDQHLFAAQFYHERQMHQLMRYGIVCYRLYRHASLDDRPMLLCNALDHLRPADIDPVFAQIGQRTQNGAAHYETVTLGQATCTPAFDVAYQDRLRGIVQHIVAQANQHQPDCIDLNSPLLIFQPGPDQVIALPDPAYYSADILKRKVRRKQRQVHGLLTCETILLDPRRVPLVLDFAACGRASSLTDYASLEISMRSRAISRRPLADWLSVDETLDAPDSASSSESLHAVIGYLREKAKHDHEDADRAYTEDLYARAMYALATVPDHRLLEDDALRRALYTLLLAGQLAAQLTHEAWSVSQLPHCEILTARTYGFWVKRTYRRNRQTQALTEGHGFLHSRHHEPLRLTPTQSRWMQHFLCHPGELQSHDRIAQNIWQEPPMKHRDLRDMQTTNRHFEMKSQIARLLQQHGLDETIVFTTESDAEGYKLEIRNTTS